mmetsp:Transcript_26985/g.60355  ORF Transcript_26985/g.60355 Transcript_26985/m.60355 type:complete len:450 (+) Transcript_26985:103-1452(+)|eukprot:CAMPEP_0172627720 /NCGR_PEP_ID=MMETSP1068-20121228/157826_1 /TAXON_ID=35684 /ORGANISM="Pseudopedinella elastica, Strain CCMP716" /LENGTH=449 /DNA_ID=CAMNT_0013437703 /DNA_START=14 /DNA_END=1363 /DNA_ORIENTATION=+
MSDEEEYEYSDEDEGSGEEDAENDVEIEIENAYYEGDDCKVSDPSRAKELFEKVIQLENDNNLEIKWRFKALQHLVAIHFRLGENDGMVTRYNEMLSYISQSAVTRNDCTSAINSALETISGGSTDSAALARIYDITLSTLKQSANNERLWFNTYVRYGKSCLARQDYGTLARVVEELHRSCQFPDGRDDPSKGTYLLEVYALEIQWCTATKNTARMKVVYPKTLNLNAAVADPRIMGLIREEGGKMYMGEQKWKAAYEEFYEGFRGYQEAGNPRAKDALKYVVLANMLALSDINPFAAREAKAYQEEKEIVAMQTLRSAYEANDLTSFERTLENKQNRILADPFIMSYVSPLRRRMREQVLLNLVKPYRRIRLEFVARELKLDEAEVEGLLVNMILDKRIDGKIDQIRGFLSLGGESKSVKAKNYDALTQWSSTLKSLSNSLSSKIYL